MGGNNKGVPPNAQQKEMMSMSYPHPNNEGNLGGNTFYNR